MTHAPRMYPAPAGRSAAASLFLPFAVPAAEAPAEAPAAFRPIHYLGSKLRLVGPILEATQEVARSRGVACDLFAGSGTVSYALARSHTVLSVDIQEYSRVICAALLSPPPVAEPSAQELLEKSQSSAFYSRLREAVEPIVAYEQSCAEAAAAGNPEPLCELVEQSSLLSFGDGAGGSPGRHLRAALAATAKGLERAGLASSARATTVRYFGGIYFSFAQAAELDGVLDAAHSLPVGQREVHLAAVLSTASEIVNTVGKQFAQPIRPRDSSGSPKGHLTRQILRDRSASVAKAFLDWSHRYGELPRRPGHLAMRADYREFLRSCSRDVAVVYADPPYTRDHYSRYYHVLETLCLRDNPAVSTMRRGGRDFLSRGAYRYERHQSPFCIKTQAPGAFRQLFEGVRSLEAPLVLSYSPFRADEGARPRLMTVEQIVELAHRSFRRVDVRSAGHYAHNKLNQQNRNAPIFYDSEVLIICRA
jgi:adenine-specific DNA-methyltransferase